MNQDHKTSVNQLNEQMNQLFYHYNTKYSAPLKIPGLTKVKPVEQKLLGLLEGRDHISIKAVVAMLAKPNSTITSAVTRLIDKGLIVKEIDPQDRRSYLLKLTRKGKDITAYSQHLKQQFSQRLLEGLNKEEQGCMIELLGKALQSLDQLDDAAVRSDFMNALQVEYNGFGPWLIEIKVIEEVPQQYMTYKDAIMAADISFKVPVKVDRHKLRPGMLMYNRVVSIFSDHLMLFEASNDGVEKHEISFDAIRYLTASRNLLDSHIVIGTDERIYDIDYNSVSTEITDRVMAILRESVLVQTRAIDEEAQIPRSAVPDKNYNILVGGFPVIKEMVILGYEPGKHLEKVYKNTAEALLNHHKKYDLQELMILADDKELLVIDSVNEVKTDEDPDYSYRHISICIADIKSVTMEDDPTMNYLKSLEIVVGATSLSFNVADDFDSSVLIKYLKI